MQQAELSFYFQFSAGKEIDLDFTSRALLGFTRAIRSVASSVDAESHIQVKLKSIESGSIKFNTIVKLLEKNILPKKKKNARAMLAAILAVVVCSFMQNHEKFNIEKALKDISDKQGLSEEEKREYLNIYKKEIIDSAVEVRKEQIARELRRDAAIDGFGISVGHDTLPDVIMSKSDIDQIINASPAYTRLKKEDVLEQVVLISPILISNSDREWTFDSASYGEIRAKIDDSDFLARAMSGEIPMEEGIKLDVILSCMLEVNGNRWAPTECRISKVTNVYK